MAHCLPGEGHGVAGNPKVGCSIQQITNRAGECQRPGLTSMWSGPGEPWAQGQGAWGWGKWENHVGRAGGQHTPVLTSPFLVSLKDALKGKRNTR